MGHAGPCTGESHEDLSCGQRVASGVEAREQNPEEAKSSSSGSQGSNKPLASIKRNSGATGSQFEAEIRSGRRSVRPSCSDQGLGTRQGTSNLAGAGCNFSRALSLHR